jgi:hydrogenase maturation factor
VFPHLGTKRPDVLVRAAIGEDSAVIDLGEWVAVLSTDPITGATHSAGWLSVHISCNDVASNGAEPVGVLVTVLLPEQAREEDLRDLMAEVHAAASELGIEVLGGHTEVTPGLASVIISTSAIGKAKKDRYVTSSGARAGDFLVLTKAVALEGTAILATDFEGQLRSAMSAEALERAQRFRAEISVVPEGLAAARLGATAMHDPTEGGVLGAIHEMVSASGLGIEINAGAIPVRPETETICRHFGADPLKLISSGAMLIACPDGEAMMKGLGEVGIVATVIGRFTPEGRWLIRDGARSELEASYRDELWRIIGRVKGEG